MKNNRSTFLRYPGGKQRYVKWLADHVPDITSITGRYIEPFVGGASVFFSLKPKKSLLSDINCELIDLYRGIKKDPEEVWEIYKNFPSDKQGYYYIRNKRTEKNDILYKAARTLYLNRTCFKGMWRHNSRGKFNVGYGGQSRRWNINLDDLRLTSASLKKTALRCSDFSDSILSAKEGDFLFLDPPYSPGEINTNHDHYIYGTFCIKDQKRLAEYLDLATRMGVNWAMTNTSHEEITKLYTEYDVIPINKILNGIKGEVLVKNY